MNAFNLYEQKILELKNIGIEPIKYGETTLGQPLYYFKLSKRVDYRKKPLKIMILAGIHAREYITTFLLLRLIEYYNVRIYRELSYLNRERKNAYLNLNYELYFFVNTNVDGFRLCTSGLDFIKSPILKSKLLQINQQNKDFSLWKANINGVDLNVNFDANFGQGKQNLRHKNFENCIGPHPNSEKETKLLVELTQKLSPDLTISYHSKGEEIYYQFFQQDKQLEWDGGIANIIAKTTKYKIKNVENCSSGGYKDWCIQSLKIPAFTIEVGNDSLSHPLQLEHLSSIYRKNKYVIRNILKHYAFNS